MKNTKNKIKAAGIVALIGGSIYAVGTLIARYPETMAPVGNFIIFASLMGGTFYCVKGILDLRDREQERG